MNSPENAPIPDSPDERPNATDAEVRLEHLLDQGTEDASAGSHENVDRLGQQLFVHGLLEHVFDANSAGMLQRIERLRQALREADQPLSAEEKTAVPTILIHRQATPRFRSGLIAAAVVAASFSMMAVWPGIFFQNEAVAAVKRTLAWSRQQADRTFEVTTRVRGPLGRERVLHSMLYLRGADRFVVRHPAPFAAGEIWVGGNGQSAWCIPLAGPILTTDGPRPLPAWLSVVGDSTPEFSVANVLERLAAHYELKQLPSESVPGASDGRPVTHIQGVRRPATKLGPDRIDLWTTPDSGRAARVVLSWQRPPGTFGPVEIIFQLAGQSELAADFFEPEAHAKPGRAKIQMPRRE